MGKDFFLIGDYGVLVLQNAFLIVQDSVKFALVGLDFDLVVHDDLLVVLNRGLIVHDGLLIVEQLFFVHNCSFFGDG